MMSKRGVNPAQAQSVVAKLRSVAARQPGDVLVQVSLAEAEYDVGDHNASLVAADAALKIDPRSVEALVYKGRAHAAYFLRMRRYSRINSAHTTEVMNPMKLLLSYAG